MSRNSGSHRSRNDNNDDSTRNHLSLDLDVKRVRPIINQYESNRRNEQDEIVPSLGLHMLQSGGGRGNNGGNSGSVVESAQAQGRSSQKQPSGDYSAFHSTSEADENRKVNVEEEKFRGETFVNHVGAFTDDKPRTSRKIAKGVLLFFLGVFIYLVYDQVSHTTKEANLIILQEQIGNGMTIITTLYEYIRTFFNTKKPFPLVQLQRRLNLGRSLLNELNDPIGAHVACSSVTNVIIHHFGGNANTASSSFLSTYLDDAESRLFADALLCMGEAKLALFSRSGTSSMSLSNAEVTLSELLHGRDALEAAVSAVIL